MEQKVERSDIVLRCDEGLYLPQQILQDILARLSTKSLIRFKSVCRDWRNMISDPEFAETNLQENISNIMILYKKWHRELAAFKLEEKGVKARKVATLCSYPNYQNLSGSSCNSLVLFQDTEKKLHLYDAINNQRKVLPDIRVLSECRKCSISLTCDASRQKYKVVVFVSGEIGKTRELYIGSLNHRKQSNTEKWRKLRHPYLNRVRPYTMSFITVQGVLYWLESTFPPFEPDSQVFIQPLDIANDKFKESIQSPFQGDINHSDIDYNVIDYSLFEMKGSVCLANAATADVLNIWILKDSVQGIWMKQHKIFLSSMLNKPRSVKSYNILLMHVVESCGGSTYIIILQKDVLYWYNMDTKEIRQIEAESHFDPIIVTVIN